MQPAHLESSGRGWTTRQHQHFPVKMPLETLLFETASVAVGSFRCSADDPAFRDSGPSSTHCFVFPQTSVWVEPADGPPYLSDPTLVTLHNRGHCYRRRAFSRAGDQCHWFAISPTIAHELPTVKEESDSDGPFKRAFVRAHPSLFLDHHRILSAIDGAEHVDPLYVEERVLHMLHRVLQQDDDRTPGNDRVRRAHQRLVDDVKALLAVWVARRVFISELAGRVGCSVFHLCRVFRAVEGMTIHQYQTNLRLREAVARLSQSTSIDLTQLAIDLGFCSHSHFSAAFRRTFGRTPSAVMSEFRGASRPSRGWTSGGPTPRYCVSASRVIAEQ